MEEPRAAQPRTDEPRADGPTSGLGMDSPRRALLLVALVTLGVSGLSHVDRLIPRLAPYVGTLVGAAFLLVSWWAVLRRSDALVRAHGLGLGGLTEDRPLAARRLARDGLRALGWALLLAAVIFPPFWLGYRAYWHARGLFVLHIPADWWDIALGQLLVVALPEEAFYRGYLQTALEQGWKSRRWRILGAELGPGWLACAAIFALGHYFALPNPNRLAVFFPALVFGWLRARTGGVGAGIAFHALCNLLTETLGRGYHYGP
jgi:uncharacterized protein